MTAYAIPSKTRFTPEEYLALERKAELKSEYLNGQIYAMAGGFPRHSEVAINVATELNVQLRRKPCYVYGSDVKVRSSFTGLYSYPDVSVVCGKIHYHDEHLDVILNPIVIVEVLSEYTEAYDRGLKFLNYRQIESLTDYILVSQSEPYIDYYSRQPDGAWMLNYAVGLTGSIYVASIDCTLNLSDVYAKIEFDALDPDAA